MTPEQVDWYFLIVGASALILLIVVGVPFTIELIKNWRKKSNNGAV